MNPTRGLLIQLLKSTIGEVELYGPGYVPESELQNGINAYIKKNGPYDLVVTNETVLFSKQARIWEKESIDDIFSTHKARFAKSVLTYSLINDIHDFLMSSSVRKLVIMLQTDFYNIRQEQIDCLKSLENLRLVTFGEDLISKIEELDYLANDMAVIAANDRWFQFVSDNSEKVISMPHFVDETEFIWKPLDGRPYDITIPGIGYWFRKEIKKIAVENLSMSKLQNVNRAYNFLNKFGISLYSSDFGLDLLSRCFLTSIMDSKMSFTCGSALKWPLRKFFELPALGTMLFCYPFKNAEKFGFIDGETCVYIQSPEEFEEKLDLILKDQALQNKIATNGRDMVFQLHTTTCRAKQMKESLSI